MKALNILFDDRYGGPQKRAIEVGRLLLAGGIETVLCLPEGEGNAERAATDAGLKCRRVRFTNLPKPSQPIRFIKWLLLLYRDINSFKRLYRDEKPDVVHVNGAFFLPPALAARMSGTPVVWHLNDTIVPKLATYPLAWMVRWIADRIVVAARAVAKHYNIPEGSYELLYAPVDVSLYSRKSSTQLGSSNNAPRIGIVANWNPVKGLSYAVEALALLIKGFGPIQLHMAGAKLETHKTYSAGIESLIDKLGVRKHIVHHGFVDSTPDFLSDIDILVLSSLSEACPMAVLEGMAAGKPIVSADVGGVRELLMPNGEESAGIMVPRENSEQLAEGIRKILTNPKDAVRYGKMGKDYAERFFSLKRCAELHASLYRSLLP